MIYYIIIGIIVYLLITKAIIYAKYLDKINRKKAMYDLFKKNNICFNILQNPNITNLLDYDTLNIKSESSLVNTQPFIVKLRYLCSNPKAIDLIERHYDKLDKICWTVLSMNPSAISLIQRNISSGLCKIDWGFLLLNKNVNQIINMNRIDDIQYLYQIFKFHSGYDRVKSVNGHFFEKVIKYGEENSHLVFLAYHYMFHHDDKNTPNFKEINKEAVKEAIKRIHYPSRITNYLCNNQDKDIEDYFSIYE
jgi:hypothetical protein